ncbi:MAG: hypothetical protein ACRYFX_19535 [Janthinobacterium lividum]
MAKSGEERTVEIIVNGQRANASLKEMDAAVAVLNAQFRKMAADDPGRAKLIDDLQEMRERVTKVRQEVAGVTATTGLMKQAFANAFAFAVGGGIEAAIGKVFELGKSIFDTTAKFEKYGAVLENALGSKSLSQKALADIQAMAAKTPFSVDELTSSFLKFVNRGLQPSMTEMTKLGDLAASQGKSFDQLTEAVLDAGTGEFERLKEFGISASKSGDQVSLSFKGVQQTVANTPEAINAAIVAFGDAKGVMGGMAMVSQTLEGQLSNLGDTGDQVAVAWGQSLKPVFMAILSTMGFFLGLLKELPSFIKENRGLLLLLGGAVASLNIALINETVASLASNAATKAGLVWKAATTAATNAWKFAQDGLNVSLRANPIGLVVTVAMLLVGAFIALYDKSEKFRAVVAGMGAALKEFVVTYVKGAAEALTGLGDILIGALTGNSDRIKKGMGETVSGLKAMYWDAGKKAAGAFHEGYEAEGKAREAAANAGARENLERLQQRIKDSLDKREKARQAAEKVARLERLKNEEADLKERLAKVKADTEQEMHLKQQLVTNAAAQELEDVKKTAAERRIILAEAQDKRVKLAQEFYEKLGKERKAKHDKDVARALKIRLAEIEAEKLHQEMLAQARHAVVVARDGEDDLATELSKIYTEGQLKRVALEAQAKKDIAQLTGTAQEKAARQLDIEKKLVADLDIVDAEWRQKQGELADKDNAETYKKKQEETDRLVEAEEERAARQQEEFQKPLHASLDLQRQIDEKRYEIRQAAFERELALIEKSQGRESAEYKKVAAAMLKDQKQQGEQAVKFKRTEEQQKKLLMQETMSAASDIFSLGLQMLDQDADARKKHHSLYVALAAAKILVDGTKEVQQIWEYQAENPLNGETMGAAGIAMGAIQTAIAVARTSVALGQVFKTDSGSSGGGSYWAGGATGTGAGLAISPMGQLLAMSGMSVGGSGRLLDGSGFAVAGVVHEDEYVIPKWQLQDPQVAAVAQWLEARRLRGFDGGGHTSASSGAALPVAAASPSSDGEKLYAVMAQVLDANLAMVQQLSDVRTWQRNLQVQLNLREAQARTDEFKQVQYNSAIRSKQ